MFIKKLMEKIATKETNETVPTVESMKAFFAYGAIRNIKATGDPSLAGRFEVGHLISWEEKESFYRGSNNIPAQIVPPHIKWSSHPVYAYLALKDNKIYYHYSDEDGSTLYICPETSDPKHIKMINELFDHYYRKFGLSVTEKDFIDSQTDYV